MCECVSVCAIKVFTMECFLLTLGTRCRAGRRRGITFCGFAAHTHTHTDDYKLRSKIKNLSFHIIAVN